MDCTKDLKSLGIGNWSKKSSKDSIIRRICDVSNSKSLDIGLLPVKDLLKIESAVINNKIDTSATVDSRYKAAYIEAISRSIPGLSKLDKLTVSSLKELIGVINKCQEQNQES